MHIYKYLQPRCCEGFCIQKYARFMLGKTLCCTGSGAFYCFMFMEQKYKLFGHNVLPLITQHYIHALN